MNAGLRRAIACLAGAAAVLATTGFVVAAAAAMPVVTVSQSTGLRDQQSVRVRGTGFRPGESLVAIECADDGQENSQQSDCNINGARSVVADPGGAVESVLTVVAGPFGINRRVCDANHACIVAVSEISLQPSLSATTPITFAPGVRPAATAPSALSSAPSLAFVVLIVLGILFVLAEYDSWSVVRRIAGARFGRGRRPKSVVPLP